MIKEDVVILIDAPYEDEVRVAVCKNGKLSEFYYQNLTQKSCKGNIYIGKISRVESSLQAAFVDYGQKKHGFLPLSNVTSNYYPSQNTTNNSDSLCIGESIEINNEKQNNKSDEDIATGTQDIENKSSVSNINIQNIFEKGQIILVQVVKEERGDKGVVLSTNITLSGRYLLLLPHSKAGLVSREITEDEERKRLEPIARELSRGNSGVILLPSAVDKTKAALQQDFHYTGRLWNKIREYAISSEPGTFIHCEADIIKKTIRNECHSDVTEVIVSGTKAFETVSDFFLRFVPGQIHKIKLHNSPVPLFSQYQIEDKVASLYHHIIGLPSGGYIVINQTEALTAIDVNSGKAVKNKNVEDTALQINLEATEEIATQIRLRNISGIIVIDFIDMLDRKNITTIEQAVLNALSEDKAKLRIGTINELGLLSISRQRLNLSVVEATTVVCHNCQGRAKIRNIHASANAILRAIEVEASQQRNNNITTLTVATNARLSLYICNYKKENILELEKKHSLHIKIAIDESAGPDCFFLDTSEYDNERFGVIDMNSEALSTIESEPYISRNNNVVYENNNIEHNKTINHHNSIEQRKQARSNTTNNQSMATVLNKRPAISSKNNPNTYKGLKKEQHRRLQTTKQRNNNSREQDYIQEGKITNNIISAAKRWLSKIVN